MVVISLEAAARPAIIDITPSSIGPGIASDSAPTVETGLSTTGDRRGVLDPTGIIFAEPQTPYQEMRGAVGETLRGLGIEKKADRDFILQSFDQLHAGEKNAVGLFREVVHDFQENGLNPFVINKDLSFSKVCNYREEFSNRTSSPTYLANFVMSKVRTYEKELVRAL